MVQSTTRAIPAQPYVSRDIAGLRLFVECHQWIFALEALWLKRIAMPGEVQLTGAESRGSSNHSGALGDCVAGDEKFMAWDLGVMMGLPSTDKMWILLAQRTHANMPQFALRTGTCLGFAAFSPECLVPFPPGFTQRWISLYPSAVPPSAVPSVKRANNEWSLCLDLGRLWNGREVDSISDTLARS